ncbi:hypothetical protein ACHAPT_010412 [Fusarium lateritium]
MAQTHKQGSILDNEILAKAFKHQQDSGLPDISVSSSQGKYIQIQAKIANAQHILEVGTLGGYSTIFLANASPTTRVTTLESVPHHVEVAQDNLAMAGLGDRVEVIQGDAIEVLPTILDDVRQGRREKFDFVFIDADKLNGWVHFDKAADMTRPGGCIIVDNVVRRGTIVNSKLIDNDKAVIEVRKLIEKAGADPRVDSLELDGSEITESNIPLPNLGEKLHALSVDLYDGKGFFTLRGLDPSEYSAEDNVIMYLGLSSYIALTRGKQDEEGNMLRQ